jgi:hypothetical protein
MNLPNHLIGFEARPLSFWRMKRNHLIDFEISAMPGDLGGAGFVARHGGGIRLIIDHELAHYMLEQLDAMSPPFLILFDAERGGRSTLAISDDMFRKMQSELTRFLSLGLATAN